MIRPKLWKGNSLSGLWEFTYKVDGVRCLKENGVALSRSGKPLHNIPEVLPDGDYEVFSKNWEESVSLVRTHNSDQVPLDCFYSLPNIDKRLFISAYGNPTEELIEGYLSKALYKGMEGLVLRQGDTWLKVKPKETYDVSVVGIQAGKGKYEGKVGAVLTEMGKVGTGFTDAQREEEYPIGSIIEVECMSLTSNGKFRHPRFLRKRWDK